VSAESPRYGCPDVREEPHGANSPLAQIWPVDKISIGPRHRKAYGDIDALARNIVEVGLLHPIVVKPDGTLIAGARRLTAYKKLRRNVIPVTVVDLEKIVLGEYAENTFRLQLTPSECADIADDVEPNERALAKERQLAGEPPAKFAEGGNALDKVSKPLGKHRDTIQKARAVRDAAIAEPERFSALQADMDRTGRVNGPFKRLKVMRQATALRAEPPPLPGRGPYRVIVADPPWPYEIRKEDPSHRATQPYAQMSIEQICALNVAPLAHADCLLWLWTTNHHIREAFTVLDAWGFVQKTILTWAKVRMGTGDWLRGQTEHCLLAVRGKPVVELTNQTTLLKGPLRANSQKPVEFYDFVEGLCPAPRYAYLFSRYRHNEKWDCHGDEAPAVDPGAPAYCEAIINESPRRSDRARADSQDRRSGTKPSPPSEANTGVNKIKRKRHVYE
jgi:N6-adenosine-specific RNA methylase IME4